MRILIWLFLLPLFALSQVSPNAVFINGTEADKVYLNGQEVYTKATGGGELYVAGDAADPNNETNTVDSGWRDQSGSEITFSSVSNGSGGFAVEGTIASTTAARAEYTITLTGGVTYDYVIVARETGGSSIRILDPRIDGGDYAGISSQPFLTGSFATYNLTLSPPSTGDYNLWFDFVGETSGHGLEIDSISIIAQ